MSSIRLILLKVAAFIERRNPETGEMQCMNSDCF